MTVWLYLGAVLGCGIGAACRHVIATRVPDGGLAWHTIAANTAGSALVGAVAAMATAHPAWAIVLGAGVAGGLSTFSTLAVDAARLWEAGERRRAASYLTVTAALGLAAAWLGWMVAS